MALGKFRELLTGKHLNHDAAEAGRIGLRILQVDPSYYPPLQRRQV